MKHLNLLSVLGLLALLFAAVMPLTSQRQAPGFPALERKPARLVVAQPGPVSFTGYRGMRTLGALPGMWVFAVRVGAAEHRFAIDRPDEPRLRRLERLGPNTDVLALMHDDEIWQLENTAGEVLVDYASRAAEAEVQKAQRARAMALCVAVGLALLAGGRVLTAVRQRARQPARSP
jgi:hypothetical protein